MTTSPPATGLSVRAATQQDAAALAEIYNHYVRHSIATFEEQPISAAEMAARLETVITAGLPWLVDASNGQINGYAYAAPWKQRSAYRHSVEISVYIQHELTQRGLGTRLYQALFAELEKLDLHSVAGGIALPNPGCVALHERFGMRKVAHFREVGFKFGRWVDVGYWQRFL